MKRRKLGTLDKDLGSSDAISVFTTERVVLQWSFGNLWKDYFDYSKHGVRVKEEND